MSENLVQLCLLNAKARSCETANCATCGWNPAEHIARKMRIRAGNLERNDKGPAFLRLRKRGAADG